MELVKSEYDYRREEVRLDSFKFWDGDVCKEKLSLTGFYFFGPNDVCKCHFCRLEIGLWEIGDNVLTKHLRWSPNCPLLRRRLTDNEPIIEGKIEEILPPTSYDVSERGAATARNNRPNAKLENKRAVRTVQNIVPRHPNHPDFVLEFDRLRSYADWPKIMKQNPKELTDAGFFYVGKGDKVKCFCCGGGLKDWGQGDNPWELHAKWYSDCDYLKLIKGEEYIKEVRTRFNVEDFTGSQILADIPEDMNEKLGIYNVD